ncbi:MAG: RCC1 domain-containing protein [Actinomycetota bacterium]|nr:RCC1 domain-containing protein [Actinomycetota bacterium]
MWASGWNGYGQLGDGTTTDRRSFGEISGFSAADWVAAGAVHTVAVR